MSGWQIFGLLCALAAPLSVAFIALIGRLNDPRAGSENAHPPHRQCGCPSCARSFEED